MYHVNKNGVAFVSPVPLFHPTGVVPHPLQLMGNIDHMPDASGNVIDHVSANAHPFFGNDQTFLKF